METTELLTLITFIVSLILGFLSKQSKFISNNLIPVQNLLVGLLMAGIEWYMTKDFSLAIALSGLLAGGVYDLPTNLNKLSIKKKEAKLAALEESIEVDEASVEGDEK